MTYDPVKYWEQRGRTYADEARRAGSWDAEDAPLIDLLVGLQFNSVLDVGCGYGRVGAAIIRHFPQVQYTGIDISSDLVEVSRDRLPGAEIFQANVVEWDSLRQWDLVVAANVLGHVRPEDLAHVWAKMERWAKRDIVHIDWNEVGASTAYQFGHDYHALHGLADAEIPMGATTLFHVVRP